MPWPTPTTGAAEVRGLAGDFNGLTRSNQALQEQQSVVLLAHQLALDVARVVHGAPEIDTALNTVCAMLGEGLSVDRIMLYTHDESGVIDQRTQWHRYDLPDLPALPPSLASEVKVVGDELRRQATVFVLSDFLARGGADPGQGRALLPGHRSRSRCSWCLWASASRAWACCR